MGCEHAPYGKICSCFASLGDLINPFPILCKDSNTRIEEILQGDPLLAQREYSVNNTSIASLLTIYQNNSDALIYGVSDNSGYPITEVLQAIAYVIANTDELYGKRPKGYIQIIERHIATNPNECVEIRRPDLLTPLVIVGNGRGTLIGARNPDVYSQLVSHDPENQYKLLVRQITEEDLRNAN